jgi:hypothetical protein
MRCHVCHIKGHNVASRSHLDRDLLGILIPARVYPRLERALKVHRASYVPCVELGVAQ